LYILDSLAILCNLISCTILVLVVRMLSRLTLTVENKRDSFNTKRRISKLVTASHILIVTMYSAAQFTLLFAKNSTQTFRMNSALYVFGGAADLFLSVMLWFILDDNKTPMLIVDGDRIYAVTTVIKQTDSLNSLDCDEEEEIAARRSID